jgi:hypothetical protein
MPSRLPTPVPDRCLLYQALLWVAEEFVPVDDRIFLSLPDRSWSSVKDEHKRDLLLALRSEALPARGVLWATHGPCLKIEDQCAEIEGAVWEWERIEWEDSTLWVERTKCKRDDKTWKCHSFEAITVPVDVLLATFPPEKNSRGIALQPPSREEEGRRRGRPQKFHWSEFYSEIAVRADLDNLPETQAELERDMADWCSETWGDVPSEARLREMVSPIYRHPRKARK